MGVTVAPVGERPVDVDADGVDVGRRPQRVEVEVDVAGAVGGLVAEVLRPVGGVGDLGGGAEDGFHVGGEVGERGDEGIGGGAVAHGGEAAQLGADDEGVDATGGNGEVRVVQDDAAEGPLGGAGVDDGLAVDGEVGDIGGADEGRDLRGGGGGLVGRAGLAGRGRDGDAAAPGVGGLAVRPYRGRAAGWAAARRRRRRRQRRERGWPWGVCEV